MNQNKQLRDLFEPLKSGDESEQPFRDLSVTVKSGDESE